MFRSKNRPFKEFIMPETATPHAPFTSTHPEQREHRCPSSKVNVGDMERLLSFLGGAVLSIYGLSRRSLPGLGLAAAGGPLLYRGVTGHCGMYQALGINTAPKLAPATSIRAGHGVRVEESMIVGRDAATLYRFWRNLENLGRFMSHLHGVQQHNDRHSRWVARGPMGVPFEWEAEIINEKENELIAWRSIDGSKVDTAGSVHFRELPHDRGTEVRVNLKYDSHSAQLAEPLARILGESPRQQIRDDLRRFKQIMEAGEVATTTGQPHGTCRG